MYPPNVLDALADHEHDLADAIRAVDALMDIDSPHAIAMRLAYDDRAEWSRVHILAIYYEHNLA